jgi:hypothetical protein
VFFDTIFIVNKPRLSSGIKIKINPLIIIGALNETFKALRGNIVDASELPK